MGTLHYGNDKLQFDDRLLAHLQIVIVQKLRRGDSFLVSWINARSIGGGRTAIWLDSSIQLRFDFAGSRTPTVNRDWLHALQESASSATGLIITGEDGQLARCGGGL